MTATPLSILLDLDGTIVDSQPGIALSCEAALTALGHRPEELDVAALIGPPLEEVLVTVLARFGDDRLDEAVRAYRDHYGRVGLLETTAYPGMAAALDGLRATGARLFVATSKRRVFAERILEHLGLIDRFDGVHGSEPGGALDHKAALIAEVLRREGLAAARCLMVGDRRHDAEGARANGVAAVGVLWGYGDRTELEAAGVSRLAARPDELVAVVAGLNADIRNA
ncbi:MAG: HAD hydrolase-like protein [Proteobacteria bacterium]|nr:HAD hydrolase-like protein [Pseudomonadota bacterium]